MSILNLTNPYVLLAAILIYLLFLILGKEFKKSILPATALFIFLLILVVYGVQLIVATDEVTNKLIISCIGYDAVLIFLSYVAYLWVDDIEAKAKNKKSIDNSLDWFWNKV